MTVNGIKRSKGESIFFSLRRIKACRRCYETILGVWLSCGLGLRRGKKFPDEMGKIRGYGSKRVIDAMVMMQDRGEKRERRGIITP